jgi:uncharacterized protein YvpB
MRNRGFGTITIAGIPTGSKTYAAYLYWDILGNTADSTFPSGVLNGQAITGKFVGSGGDPCWGNAANFAYRADVTSLVSGNGSYALSGFASGITDGRDPWTAYSYSPPMLEGASLIVIYSNPASPITQLLIDQGATEFDQTPLTLTITGFTAPTPVGGAWTTFIGADGQTDYPKPVSTFNGTPLSSVAWDGSDPQAGPPYSNGDLWDTVTANVTSLVHPGDTSATATAYGMYPGGSSYDCLVWVAQVFAVASIVVVPSTVVCTPSAGTIAPGSTVTCRFNAGTGAAFRGWAATGFNPTWSSANPASFVAGNAGRGTISANWTLGGLVESGIAQDYTITAGADCQSALRSLRCPNAWFQTQFGSSYSPAPPTIDYYTGGDNCGPASIAMAIDYYATEVLSRAMFMGPINALAAANSIRNGAGNNITATNLDTNFGLDNSGTGVASRLLLAHYGLQLSSRLTSLNDIEQQIDEGLPVIVLVDSNDYKTPRLYGTGTNDHMFADAHIVVVTGYDSSNVFINDPMRGGTEAGFSGTDFNFPISATTFQHAFQDANNTQKIESPDEPYAAAVEP